MAARKPFLLRLDPTLWADLEVWARDELRSVNGQIEYLLRQAVVRRKKAAAANPHPTDPPARPARPNPAVDPAV